jgi:uncharacterized protein YndB with AHSA1/START domain
MMTEKTPVGKTKTQGWEIGVRRTLPISAEKAWEMLMTQPGLGYWLGNGVELDFKKGERYETEEGTTGEIRSYNEGSLIRMTWQPRQWDFDSTLQIRVQPARTGTTISVHHERLKNGEQREAMRAHWTEVIDKLRGLIQDT